MKPLRHQKGPALVEPALSIPRQVLILLGVIEFDRVRHPGNTPNLAAREGARMATGTTSPADTGKVAGSPDSRLPLDQTGTNVSTTTDPVPFAGGTLAAGVPPLPPAAPLLPPNKPASTSPVRHRCGMSANFRRTP